MNSPIETHLSVEGTMGKVFGVVASLYLLMGEEYEQEAQHWGRHLHVLETKNNISSLLKDYYVEVKQPRSKPHYLRDEGEGVGGGRMVTCAAGADRWRSERVER